jgi:hypothetical protein
MQKTFTLIEFMPPCWRASHVSAGNSGYYPHNGATRVWVEGDVDTALLDPQWAEVVRIAPRLPEGEQLHSDVPCEALAA